MKQVIKKISKSKRVAIIAHLSPDGDCLGSMTALSCALSDMGKIVKCFVDTTNIKPLYKEFYNLPQDINSDIDISEFDTIITVDLASVSQLGKYYKQIKTFNNIVIIDHHSLRDFESKCQYVNTNVASCCEIIFELLIKLKAKITPQMATYLFSGLITDTNCFQNDNVNAQTFGNAKVLAVNGADINAVIFKFVKQKSQQEIALQNIGYQNMTLQNGVGYNIFTLKQFKDAGSEECSDFVNEILNIDNTKFAFVIKQKEKSLYSVSLRCKKGYDVSLIAQKFGGGGHKLASGFTFIGAPLKMAKLIYNECLEQQNKGIDNV